MYDPKETYWLQVETNKLPIEVLEIIDKLERLSSLTGSTYMAIMFCEFSDDFIVYKENSTTFAIFIEPAVFIKLVNLSIIDKDLAMRVCIDLVKTVLAERCSQAESGGLDKKSLDSSNPRL